MHELLDLLMIDRIQVFAVLGSLFMLLVILRLIKSRRLKEEYALLWIAVFSLFTFVSFFTPALTVLARFLGIVYAPSALLLLLIVGVIMILVHYSLVISRLSEQNKKLVQELALLKNQLGIHYEQENP